MDLDQLTASSTDEERVRVRLQAIENRLSNGTYERSVDGARQDITWMLDKLKEAAVREP